MAVGTLLRRAVTPAAVLLLWEVLGRAGVLDVRFVPPPSRVAAAWLVWLRGGGPAGDPYAGTWLLAARDSAYRVLLGFAVAAAVGTAAGALVGWYRVGEDLLDPLIQIARPIPITAWVPFAIIFFGFYTASAVFLIALGAFFPIFVNTAAGIRRVPSVLVRAARMLGTPPRLLLPRVALPAALPYVLTGLRIGMGAAWVLVIVSEMVAVKSGLGYSLWNAYYFLRMDIIIAAMASVGGLGFLSDRLLIWAGRPLLRWSEGD
ncbi:MAG: ABC transporter permease [Armatimonadota bacterium]|nr:ABC transporter permease [Armatimonadota bacterium]MDR7505983.1 ABC transporter permease [Armatimonadota bacterium]MDR7516661.1 ABC transporter permease [Armatimonadota bacterium]MDR7559933.1 ABC transporter permease [Armatimonadota bacterium]MDR7587502.1 ABC transporter permease [Armatimonadota bacterium]